MTYESSNRPGSSRGHRPPSYRYRKHEEAALKIRRDFMGVALEDIHQPNLFLAWKAPGSTLHWERWEALRQLVLAHETLSMAALSEALHRLGRQVGVGRPAPDHQLEISRAQALLKENAWATRQSSWHRGGRPRMTNQASSNPYRMVGSKLFRAVSQQPPQDPQAGAKLLGGLVGLGFLFYLGYMFYGGGVEKEAAETMRTIEQQVAQDAVAQYNITKQSGTPIDQCVHAGMAAVAYLQAKDQSSYTTWKATERRDCAAAGVSQ